jgi:hypothetical protein
MKSGLIVTALIILITGMASSAICQPELVCVENGVERKIEGIEKNQTFLYRKWQENFF